MTKRQPLSHLRGAESFRRKPGKKPPRSVTLIVCEGETEQEYFEAVRIQYGLTTAEVIVALPMLPDGDLPRQVTAHKLSP